MEIIKEAISHLETLANDALVSGDIVKYTELLVDSTTLKGNMESFENGTNPIDYAGVTLILDKYGLAYDN